MQKFYLLIIIVSVASSGFKPAADREENIDHIILAINDLEKGKAQFKKLTGVEPVFGGVHPKSFSQNALVALDNEVYIEIMAPRPDAQNVPEYMKSLEILTPVGWAIRTRNINTTKEKLKALEFPTTANRPGSRAKPDGSLLTWTTFGVEGKEAFPFFIEWGTSSTHPSQSSPKGCTLKSLKVISTDAKSFKKLNEKLRLGIEVSEGKDQIALSIDTPNGLVSFPSSN